MRLKVTTKFEYVIFICWCESLKQLIDNILNKLCLRNIDELYFI